MKKILVKCTLFVPVDVTGMDEENLSFTIEENSCPGTGTVGSVIDTMIEDTRKRSVCWACNFRGKNEIVDYDYKGEEPA